MTDTSSIPGSGSSYTTSNSVPAALSSSPTTTNAATLSFSELMVKIESMFNKLRDADREIETFENQAATKQRQAAYASSIEATQKTKTATKLTTGISLGAIAGGFIPNINQRKLGSLFGKTKEKISIEGRSSLQDGLESSLEGLTSNTVNCNKISKNFAKYISSEKQAITNDLKQATTSETNESKQEFVSKLLTDFTNSKQGKRLSAEEREGLSKAVASMKEKGPLDATTMKVFDNFSVGINNLSSREYGWLASSQGRQGLSTAITQASPQIASAASMGATADADISRAAAERQKDAQHSTEKNTQEAISASKQATQDKRQAFQSMFNSFSSIINSTKI